MEIKTLQNIIKDRDFNPNDKSGYFLKLIEEVGELAKAIRKNQKMESKTIKDTVDEELYDVLYYVLALANVYDVDMENSIELKEKINLERKDH